MTIETFVRASGAVMGLTRESFGTGGGAPSAPVSVGEAPAAPPSSGQAADRAATDAADVRTAVSTLNGHDENSRRELDDAIASAAGGRSRMDRIIAAALADVGDADVSTPQGQRALVEAIARHLEDSKGTLDGAALDSGTRAAAAQTSAAGYNGVASTQPTPPMMPMSGMPAGMGMPMGGGAPSMGALGSLPQLASMITPNGGGAGTDATAAAPTEARRLTKPAPPVQTDPRSVARYIYQAARARGYNPHDALAITAYAKGEAGFNPVISGGPQGGGGAENTVIGEFQEKPQFARDVGLDPAVRYTVEGNTEAYLRTLAKHRSGDIFDQLFATSVGGPMYTGGRSYCRRLMAETRPLIDGIEDV